MRAKGLRTATLLLVIGFGSLVFQSCPLTNLLEDCLGEDTISAAEYEALNVVEQLLYEENWCGRYERQSGLLDNLFD